jgi:hypothetical protein
VPLIRVDNKSAIALIKNTLLSGQSVTLKLSIIWSVRVLLEARFQWISLGLKINWLIYSQSHLEGLSFRNFAGESASLMYVSSTARIRGRMSGINLVCLV